MEIQFQSDIGRRRQMNQDYANVFVNQTQKSLAILADGMGGHLAGDVASKMAVNGLGAAWEASDISDSEKVAQWFIHQIQKKIKKFIKKALNTPRCREWGQPLSVLPYLMIILR